MGEREVFIRYWSVIDLQEMAIEGQRDTVLTALTGYKKCESIVASAAVGLPIPPTCIFLTADKFARKKFADLCESWGDIFWLRFENTSGRIGSPVRSKALRGEAAWEEIQRATYQSLAVIVAGPEAADTDHNGYNFHLVLKDGRIRFEIAGPGFIEGDIAAGHVVNERFELLENLTDEWGVRDYWRVSPDDYRQMVSRKILGKVQKGGWEAYLRRQPAILRHRERYTPVQKEQIDDLMQFLAPMTWLMEEKGWGSEGIIFYASYLMSGRKLVFWDFDRYGKAEELSAGGYRKTGGPSMPKTDSFFTAEIARRMRGSNYDNFGD